MTAYPDLQLYIGGAWRKTSESLPVLNPADESVIAALPVPVAPISTMPWPPHARASGSGAGHRRGRVARSCSRRPR